MMYKNNKTRDFSKVPFLFYIFDIENTGPYLIIII